MNVAKLFGWQVANPNEIKFGKSYSAWLEEWEKWLISDYPDRSNNGPVYFTRGVNCEIPYNRFVRTEDKRFIMSTHDAIFHVVIAWMNTSNTDRHLPNSSARTNDAIASALKFVPKPNNAKIIKRNPDMTIEDLNIVSSFPEHLTVTREFQIIVPEPDYDDKSSDKEECKNLNQFLDHPIEPGENLSVAVAYCFFIQPTEPGIYYLASNGKAENNYTTTTFLEIEVVEEASDVQSKIIEDLIKKTGVPPMVNKKNSERKIQDVVRELFT